MVEPSVKYTPSLDPTWREGALFSPFFPSRWPSRANIPDFSQFWLNFIGTTLRHLAQILGRDINCSIQWDFVAKYFHPVCRCCAGKSITLSILCLTQSFYSIKVISGTFMFWPVGFVGQKRINIVSPPHSASTFSPWQIPLTQAWRSLRRRLTR